MAQKKIKKNHMVQTFILFISLGLSYLSKIEKFPYRITFELIVTEALKIFAY